MLITNFLFNNGCAYRVIYRQKEFLMFRRSCRGHAEIHSVLSEEEDREEQ